MDFKNILQGKTVPLGIIIILITYLVSGSSTSILPFIFFTGIIMGILKNSDVVEAAVTGLIVSIVGSIISTIINLGIIYVSYGPMYLNYVLATSLYSVIFYIVVGAVGGVIGYYLSGEMGN